MEELDHFYLDVTRMPCQHLKVCCAQGLSAILKNTFTMADWLSVPAWLTVAVEELSWCHSVLASELDGYTRMTLTHLDTPGWLVLIWKPYMEDTPASLGSTWNGHTWTHWTLGPWNLLWILPDNSYGFFQTTLMDSSRQLLWILPDNSYGFFQTTLMDSSRQLLWILPDPLDLHDPWPNW